MERELGDRGVSQEVRTFITLSAGGPRGPKDLTSTPSDVQVLHVIVQVRTSACHCLDLTRLKVPKETLAMKALGETTYTPTRVTTSKKHLNTMARPF